MRQVEKLKIKVDGSYLKNIRFEMTGGSDRQIVVYLQDEKDMGEWSCTCMAKQCRDVDCRHIKSGKIIHLNLRDAMNVIAKQEAMNWK